MEKKELKFYEAPELEVLKMEIEGSLLANSDNPLDDSTADTPEED